MYLREGQKSLSGAKPGSTLRQRSLAFSSFHLQISTWKDFSIRDWRNYWLKLDIGIGICSYEQDKLQTPVAEAVTTSLTIFAIAPMRSGVADIS